MSLFKKTPKGSPELEVEANMQNNHHDSGLEAHDLHDVQLHKLDDVPADGESHLLLEEITESLAVLPESTGGSFAMTPESIVATQADDADLGDLAVPAAASAVAVPSLGRRISAIFGGKDKSKGKRKNNALEGLEDIEGLEDLEDLEDLDLDLEVPQADNVFTKPVAAESFSDDAVDDDARLSAILADIGRKPKPLPLIGGLAPKMQYGIGLAVMAAALVGGASLASLAFYDSSQFQGRSAVGTQLKMLSQRLLATTQYSVAGSSDAFNKLRDSRAEVTAEFDKLLKGTSGLRPIETSYNDHLTRAYNTYTKDVLPLVDKVLSVGAKLGDLPSTAASLNDQSAAVSASAERLLAHLISVGAPDTQITTVHQLIESNERMRRSGLLLLTSSEASNNVGDKVMEDRTEDQFKEFKALLGRKWALDPAAGLTSDGQKVNEQYKEVDSISDRYVGSNATIFQINGDDLQRVATSLKKEDGSRAIGTMLGKAHPAYSSLMNGGAYVGRAVLFGRPYITRYEAVKDSAGKVIGALFIGIEIGGGHNANQVFAEYTSAFKQVQQGVESLRKGNEALGMPRLVSDADLSVMADIDKSMAQLSASNAFIQDRATQIIEARASMASLLIAAESALLSSDRFSTDMSKMAQESLVSLYYAMGLLILAVGALAVVGVVNNRLTRLEAWNTAFKNKSNERDIIDFMSEILPLELGDLTVAFTDNTAAMEGITGGIRSSVSEAVISLREAMSTVRSTTDSVIENVSQSVAGSRDLSESNARQAMEIDGVVSRVAELTNAIDQVAGETNRATAMTEAAKSASDTGAKVVSQTNEKMTEIRASMQDVLKSVKHLGETSHEIGSIVEAIETITDRTQVIAVNASLEAAKAGAAGQGFSVLAGEVNRLAEQSNEALRTITALVQRIQGETAATIRVVEDSTSNVVEGARLSEAANAELTKISALSESLQQIMKEIHAQSQNQSDSAGSVRDSMDRLVNLSSDFQNAVQKMVHGVESIDASMGTLQSTVSIFKIAEEAEITAEAAPAEQDDVGF